MGAENHGVTPLDFPLLTDENIAPDVVAGLRARGLDLRTAWDEQLIGRPDVEILEHASAHGRVVLTHDLAFGRSAMRVGTSFERDYIAAALRASGGHRAKAAEKIGTGAATLYRKLKQERQ